MPHPPPWGIKGLDNPIPFWRTLIDYEPKRISLKIVENGISESWITYSIILTTVL